MEQLDATSTADGAEAVGYACIEDDRMEKPHRLSNYRGRYRATNISHSNGCAIQRATAALGSRIDAAAVDPATMVTQRCTIRSDRDGGGRMGMVLCPWRPATRLPSWPFVTAITVAQMMI